MKKDDTKIKTLTRICLKDGKEIRINNAEDAVFIEGILKVKKDDVCSYLIPEDNVWYVKKENISSDELIIPKKVNSWEETSIEELGINTHAYTVLARSGIHTLGELLENIDAISNIRGMGKKTTGSTLLLLQKWFKENNLEVDYDSKRASEII